MKQRYRTDILTTLVITLLGVFQGQVTVFYIVYLFWFQELIRTMIDFAYLFHKKETIQEKLSLMRLSFGSFFVLFVYFVFIVVLFTFMLHWNQRQLLIDDIRVLVFRNGYFNANILLFLIEYGYYRTSVGHAGLQLQVFNRRHTILHISIILGALISLSIMPRLDIHDNQWVSAWTIVPFLLLKIFIDKPESDRFCGNTEQ